MHCEISHCGVGLKTGRRKTGRENFDTFLDITFLLLELFFKFKYQNKTYCTSFPNI